MFDKMWKRNSKVLKLVMFITTLCFLGWCTFLSLKALEEANREAAERAKAE